MKKAALIEIGGSHDECLYSQILFLKEGGYEVTLICSSNLKKQVEEFPWIEQLILLDFESKGTFGKWNQLLILRRFIIQQKFQKVIINTAHGKKIRNLLLLPFPASVEFSGTIHNTRYLTNSSTQRLISRKIKKYFFLNDYLLQNFSNLNSDLRVETYYPIFFPEVPKTQIDKNPEEIWICIPGQVEEKRRDYQGLINSLQKESLSVNIKFILLGRCDHSASDGEKIKSLVSSKGLQNHFVFFDGFIENDIFHTYFSICDFVLPLTHSSSPGMGTYSKNQVSGAFNLAFAYKKPLISEEEFEKYEDFRDSSLFYKKEKIASLIYDLPQLVKQKFSFYTLPKWSFSYQQEKYINFIER